MKIAPNLLFAAPALLSAAQVQAQAQSLTFVDPLGDDFGPGEYTYPAGPAYTRGSFDLSSFVVAWNKTDAIFNVNVDAQLEDPLDRGPAFRCNRSSSSSGPARASTQKGFRA